MSSPMPPPEWEHLKCYGYAPGGYVSRCCHCGKHVAGLDKLAITCRPCAEKLNARGALTGAANDLLAAAKQARSALLTKWPIEVALANVYRDALRALDEAIAKAEAP